MDTKGIITNATLSLMKRKSISDLTVQEILDEAHVSRRTFYCHFADKYEVINNYFHSKITEEIKTDFNGQNWDEIMFKLFCLLRDNAHYFTQVVNDLTPNSFDSYLTKWFERKFSGFYLFNNQKKELDEEEILMICFYAMGMQAYTNNILRNPKKFMNKEKITTYAALTTKLIPVNCREIINQN